jgi:AraC-like DNA-binding protein
MQKMTRENEEIRYQNEELPFYITRTFGRRPSSDDTAHWHQDVELLYMVKGEKTFLFDDQKVTVREGGGLVIMPHILHQGLSSSCDFICVRFHPMLLCVSEYMEKTYVLPLTENEDHPFVVLDPEKQWMADVLHMIQRAYMFYAADTEGFPLLAEHCFFAVWHLLYVSLPHAEEVRSESSRISALKKMLKHIQDHYDEPISLADIADAANVSESAAGALFSQILHDSPHHYLQTYRLERAKLLLYKTDDAVTDIAFACGFSDSSYFTRAFKQAFGITPLQYRKDSRLPYRM